ncbi:MAG: hypothetical protein HF308_14400 [Ignavibacteria bacterium]|jgi:hypothetical protein|nr:hypothetical protein [Ignavibacteria bacterium]
MLTYYRYKVVNMGMDINSVPEPYQSQLRAELYPPAPEPVPQPEVVAETPVE